MATYDSDGTQSDFLSKYNSATTGDTVTIASGSFTWTTATTVSKAIIVQGGGAGRVVARSASSVAVGTGTKTFTLVTESVTSMESLKSAITGGATLKISEMCNEGNYMQGTVTSLSGTTLTMNITSTGGSGTLTLWLVSTNATTTITNNVTSNGNIFDTHESSAASLEIKGIRFKAGSSTGIMINHEASSSGYPILIHDNYFETTTVSAGLSFIRTSTNRGIIWSNSFVASVEFVQSNVVGVQQKDGNNTDVSAKDSWAATSTMGTGDTTGKLNLYVEDCDFHGMAESIDADDNGRIVVRDCLANNSGMGTHGADTSTYGVRHFEFYDNQWAFNDRSSLTFNLSHWLYFRGGTGLATGNIMPDISSGYWGDKPEVRIQVQNLQRSAGPHPLWGDNIAGVQYPCPRQFGMGRVTGASDSDAYTYNGDSEPFYQWSNSGAGNYASPSIENYTTPTGNQDDVADYVQVGRDYLNSTKSGYTKYTYPHPLRTGGGAPPAASGGGNAPSHRGGPRGGMMGLR